MTKTQTENSKVVGKLPKTVELLSKIKGTKKEVDLQDFKASVLALFNDTLKIGGVTDEVMLGKIARLRAKIEIELKEI